MFYSERSEESRYSKRYRTYETSPVHSGSSDILNIPITMKYLFHVLISILLINICGCNPFKSKKEEEFRERIYKYQEDLERRSDSIRREQYKRLSDSSNQELRKSLDSLKRSSDSLEKVLKKNIEELKKK